MDGANRSVSSFASEVDNKSDGSSVTIKASKFSEWGGWVVAAGLGLTLQTPRLTSGSRCNI